MKARIPPEYLIFASAFSLDSLIKALCGISFKAYTEPNDDFGFIGKQCTYHYCSKTHNVLIVQTWVMDLLYDLISHSSFGDKTITDDETLHLINLYNSYSNKKPTCNKEDILLYFYGFLGEQMKMQTQYNRLNGFERENYILNVISKKDDEYSIDVPEEFKQETGYTIDEYSALIASIWGYCTCENYILNADTIKINTTNPTFSVKNFFDIINKHSLTIEGVKSSNLNRQVFYSYPFIKLNNDYVSVNPFLLICLLENSNYWVMRNRYWKKNSQLFINAFGKYFELYVKEIFVNCLSKNEYLRIPEGNHKRADWKLSLFGREILIEQKSTVSAIGIKQNISDINKLKNYIINTWNKAAKQLQETECDLQLNQPIKIILLYEDYYKAEALDELFRLTSDIENDRRFWLITIQELEMFMMLYKKDPERARIVFETKDNAEQTQDKNGRELLKFLGNEDVKSDEYLTEFGIKRQFDRIKDLLTNNIEGDDHVG